MRTLLGALVIASSILGTSGSISAQQQTETATTVDVQNNFKDRIAVFVEYGDFDRRIGTVDPMSTAELPLPDFIVRRQHPIELFVVRGGQDLATQSLEVRPGEKIGLIVPQPEPRQQRMTVELPDEELSKTTLTVENERSRELVVYAEEGPFEVRLGRVSPNSTATLNFPASVVRADNTITVLVHPRGEFELESYPLQLTPGEHLGLRLTPN